MPDTLGGSQLTRGLELYKFLPSHFSAVLFVPEGSLEVILDRKLAQDDWRGLDEGIMDNLTSFGEFILLFERANRRHAHEVSY